MSKLTKNYIAVQEGKMSKTEFLRQTRQQYPTIISQFNSYDDAISILRGKRMLSEEVVYQCIGDKFPLESIERGIDYELEKMGYRTDLDSIASADYKTAKEEAIKNLSKDRLYYIKQEAVCCDKAKHTEAEAEKKKGSDHKQKKVEGPMTRVQLKETKKTVAKKQAKPSNSDNKLLKEAVTKAIVKVLSEAATVNLAHLSDEHASIQGIPAILNTLENTVTEIESFILKMQSKVQGAFDSIGDIKDEDGIPVGYKFIQPILESFKKDLEPVMQKASLDNLKLPEVPEIEPQQENPEMEVEPEVEPKHNVFAGSQLSENKQPRKRYTR